MPKYTRKAGRAVPDKSIVGLTNRKFRGSIFIPIARWHSALPVADCKMNYLKFFDVLGLYRIRSTTKHLMDWVIWFEPSLHNSTFYCAIFLDGFHPPRCSHYQAPAPSQLSYKCYYPDVIQKKHSLLSSWARFETTIESIRSISACILLLFLDRGLRECRQAFFESREGEVIYVHLCRDSNTDINLA